MKQKVLAFFMMGLVSLGGLTGLVFAQHGPATNDNFSQGFELHQGNSQGVGVGGAGEDQKGGLIGVIKKFVNRTLSLLSLITLVFLLWGGFQMVTAAGDETKYKEGFKILKHAGIGLAFIAVSWFIVSIIFRVIGGVGAGAPNTSTGMQP